MSIDKHILFAPHAIERFKERTDGQYDRASFASCCTVMRGMIYKDGVELGGQKGESKAIEAVNNVTGEKLVMILEPVYQCKTVLTPDQYQANIEAQNT